MVAFTAFAVINIVLLMSSHSPPGDCLKTASVLASWLVCYVKYNKCVWSVQWHYLNVD